MVFRVQIVVRMSVILIGGYSAIFVLIETPYKLLSFWILLATVLFTFSFIKFLERHRRDMTTFLASISQNDFTTTFSTQEKTSSAKWYREFNVINAKFQQLSSQNQANFHLLEAIVEHTGVPLICFYQETGNITIMNQAAKQLFQKPFFATLSSLSHVAADLPSTISAMHSGERQIYYLAIGNETIPLSMLAKELKIENQTLKLIAFQNIKHELEKKEFESWQKLIKVLTHEIKNSAIPISTLSSVIRQILVDDNGQLKNIGELNPEDATDLINGLQTVEKRSTGLVNFVENYSKLSKVPEPKKEHILISDLFSNIENLMRKNASDGNVSLTFSRTQHSAYMDSQLIEQVLINLIKNAIQACKKAKNSTVSVTCEQHNNDIIIKIKDNGIGIEQDELEDIFVPFYTTKQEGSGIGLSISRQIVFAHGGSIVARSAVGKGSVFEVRLVTSF